MNAPAPVTARLADPAELITALPYLLGFHPKESLVVITVVPGAPPTVGLVMRADLPPPGHEHQVVELLCGPLRANAPGAVMVVVVGDRDCAPAAVAVLRAALDDLGVVVAHALWAESTALGARWTSLDGPGRGVLPDPVASEIAAASVAAGLVTFADRADLGRLLAPDDPDTLQRRGELLDDAVRAADLERAAGGTAAAALRDVELVGAAVAAAAAGRLPDDDRQVVGLAVALADPAVRDCCLALCLGDTAPAAERLWQALTRMTPAPEVAEPAALAALAAYLRGDGALAGMALDRALDAWPGHSLSTLLHYVLHNAVPPQRLRQYVADATEDAERGIAEER